MALRCPDCRALPDRLLPVKSICQTCGGAYERKHPAQRFCTHKGAGNCKDRFWNAHPARIERTVAVLGERGIEVDTSRIGMTPEERDHDEAMSGAEMGWDAHKDIY